MTIEGSGIPLTDALVFIYDSGGSPVSVASTWEGDYLSSWALPTGTYFARAVGPSAGVGVQSELYDDILCPSDSCDPMTGDSISVTAPGTTSGVDFNLPRSRGGGGAVDPLTGLVMGGLVGIALLAARGRKED